MGLDLAACAAVVRAFDVVLAESDKLAGCDLSLLSAVMAALDVIDEGSGESLAVVPGELKRSNLTLHDGKGEVGGRASLRAAGDVTERLGKSRLLLRGGEVHVGDVVGLVEIGGELVGLGRVVVGQGVEVLALELGVAEVTLALVVSAEDDRLQGFELGNLSAKLSDLGVLDGDACVVELCVCLELLDLTGLTVRLGGEKEDRVLGVLLGGGSSGDGLHDRLRVVGRVVGRGGSKEGKDGVDVRHDGLQCNDLAKVQVSPRFNPYSLINVEKIARPKAYQFLIQSLIVTTCRWASDPCSGCERRHRTNRSRRRDHASG